VPIGSPLSTLFVGFRSGFGFSSFFIFIAMTESFFRRAVDLTFFVPFCEVPSYLSWNKCCCLKKRSGMIPCGVFSEV